MADALPLMKSAFIQLSEGRARVPVRTNLNVEEHHGDSLIMPVFLPDQARTAVKVVSVYRGNPSVGLPLIHGVLLVLDAETGRPLSLMDAEYLTALRTGAASALATDCLARRDAKTLAVFGTGVQARFQVRGIHQVRPLETVWVCGRTPRNVASFVEEVSDELDVPVMAASPREALANAELVCTATTSDRPLFETSMVRPGTHLNAVGGYRPDMTEIPLDLLASATVVVDHRASCLAEAGELVQAEARGFWQPSDVHGELGEIAAGTLKGRGDQNEITLFKSVGNAVQDLAVAAFILERAEAMSLGTRLSF
ncbi:ornithine cyclodeaminase family protein [Sulfidibacter corallicola]|uniref:Ornithine cyclodeaminase family protein n=2 Tax=Sulfidibacter corallicola TaxID=2818388 RepID=A0A8A4TY18_SULCO|nr:ornithine cyclodeaminase family protein [Sulfidibacter corallicola]